MRTIDQILDDNGDYELTAGNAMWLEDNVKMLMKEYAREVIQEILDNPYTYWDMVWCEGGNGGGSAKGEPIMEAIEKLIG